MVKIVKTKNSGIQRLAWAVRNFRTGAFHFCKWLFLILICMITCKEKLFTGRARARVRERERERYDSFDILTYDFVTHLALVPGLTDTPVFTRLQLVSYTHSKHALTVSAHWELKNNTSYKIHIQYVTEKKPEWQFLVWFFEISHQFWQNTHTTVN